MYFNLLSFTIPLYLILYQILFSVATTNSLVLYHPLDNIAVNCGSSGNSTAEDGRQWTGDIGSNYAPLLHSNKGKLISSKATNPSLSPDPVPYTSARLSRWPFTYAFQVSPGQKFIRLHFYPASYRGGYKRSEAFFTVKAGSYTLLSNFSASLTADASGLDSLVKEYCVNVEENQPLIITFSPSLGGSSDEAYAFVNGIEIVSMPAGLYHTQEGDAGAHVVGQNFRLPIDKSIALEMVHRLNVGGTAISSIEDTGLFRDWSQDSNSLMETSYVQPVTTTLRIKYTSVPSYTAPQKVYQTSWSMAIDRPRNGDFNFTWKLPIDFGFRYLLRLHFCDFEYEIEERDRTKFSVFFDEHVAEAKADIIKWSGGNRVAVYRDYVVRIEGDRMEGKHDLLTAYFPHNHEWIEDIDTVLKGLEVFKLSNPDKNLAGVNPVPLSYALTSSNAKPRKSVYASGGNVIATILVILLTVTNIGVYMLRVSGEKFSEKNISPSPPEGLCRRFSLSEVLLVTKNFSHEFFIGSGGFGNVYKALIDDGTTTVAFKRLNSKSKQGADEFRTEIEMLSNLRHIHLVSLIGYCDERQEMILVYEYMEHGTLADHLYKHYNFGNSTICHLSWEQRMKICIGAARGLDYLHTDESNITGNWQISAGSDTDMPYLDGRILPTPNLRIFSFSELKKATKNFRIDNLLGEGRFGTVYKGWLDAKVTSKNGSRIVVAIKQMDYRDEHTVGPLCGLSHSNLVKILGYCWEDQKLFLVYEFMQNGSLEQHLFRTGSAVQPMPWDTRVKILIGAARGLAFLHELETPVICIEFKASNILLDESFNSKISDFSYGEYVPTRYPGTHPVYKSYIAPEYVRTGHHVHVKGDVYSFGVVLLEMLTGLCAWDTNLSHQQRNPVGCVKPYLADRRKLATVIDSRLEGRYPGKAALQIAHLALHCLEDQPKTRPSMKQVVETLESISASNGNPWELRLNSPGHDTPAKEDMKIEEEIESGFRQRVKILVDGKMGALEHGDRRLEERDDPKTVVNQNQQSFNSKISDFSYAELDSPESYVPDEYDDEGYFAASDDQLPVKNDVYCFGVVLSFNSKISDFSYAELDSPESSVPDEYDDEGYFSASDDQLPVKNDVYCFGVVLVEMLTGSRASKRLWQSVGEKNISRLPPEGLCHRFSLSEILSLTNNFDDELVIGSGGFGNVYIGLINDGTTTVAMKRLNSKSKQGADELRTEIEMLSNLRHMHLLSLIGYCDER
ncbi:hypothetical protein RHGRI_028576 [Rhododendron griersonianum]|uniref:Protein kinase domain-containing protein n=1 Tax=Rhododendron griersonianum TaxID=479676 RepID=A0AAV6ILV8_9ERIC|nr:hypothetical protein RHGRI_028576 [Rhododendron griersonianum]